MLGCGRATPSILATEVWLPPAPLTNRARGRMDVEAIDPGGPGMIELDLELAFVPGDRLAADRTLVAQVLAAPGAIRGPRSEASLLQGGLASSRRIGSSGMSVVARRLLRRGAKEYWTKGRVPRRSPGSSRRPTCLALALAETECGPQAPRKSAACPPRPTLAICRWKRLERPEGICRGPNPSGEVLL